jgi:hypothetical protein
VAAITQFRITLSPTGRWARGFIVVSAVSCSILTGCEPTVGTGVLMVFIGLSAGAGFSLGIGGVVIALAVFITALSVLASGQGTGNIGVGAVAVVGFLAAAGRKQYALRAEEAELRLADAERAREEHALAAALAVGGLSEARQAVGTLRSDAPPLID